MRPWTFDEQSYAMSLCETAQILIQLFTQQTAIHIDYPVSRVLLKPREPIS
jgi:hypothetical protein